MSQNLSALALRRDCEKDKMPFALFGYSTLRLPAVVESGRTRTLLVSDPETC
jgi:hypothetical protein